MSTVVPVRFRAPAGLSSLSRNLFETPQPAGRRITAGFSYLQRISKPGSYSVWFPKDLRAELDIRKAQGQDIGPNQFKTQWAAIRQFELLHEAGNHKIYDLDPQMFERTIRDLTKSMRAGGYRITVATLGHYEGTSNSDELEILDQRLQEGIAQMIHMLYLEEASDQANAENDAHLKNCEWDYREDLPHIGIMLGAGDVFCREQNRPKAHKLAKKFFNILNSLPQNHIVHDTAVGLQLPELNGENQWNYIAHPEETLAAFNHVLCSVFDKFNGISLSRLNGHEDAHSEIKASALHLRGYGDRLNGSCDRFYRQASLMLN